MASIDDEWSQYLLNDEFEITADQDIQSTNIQEEIPKCDELYISTKQGVIFKSKVTLKRYFKHSYNTYSEPKEGVIKNK